MSWTLTVSGAAVTKAGNGVSATLLANATEMDRLSDYAEAELSALTKYDWVTNYASITSTFQKVLGQAVSDRIAMLMINYDMSDYFSKVEAQTKLDLLSDSYLRLVNALKDKSVQDAMGAA